MASKLNIREANEHLQKLHQRVYEMESQLQLQAIHVEELQRANGRLEEKVRDVLKEKEAAMTAKDAQLSELGEQLLESERRVQQLLEAAEERDATLMRLDEKTRLFYTAVEHKSSLAKILEVLEEVSGSEESSRDGPPEPLSLAPTTGEGNSRSYDHVGAHGDQGRKGDVPSTVSDDSQSKH